MPSSIHGLSASAESRSVRMRAREKSRVRNEMLGGDGLRGNHREAVEQEQRRDGRATAGIMAAAQHERQWRRGDSQA